MSELHLLQTPIFIFCLFVCNRLPEADDCGREHHSLNVPLPVAACVRSHPARLPSPFPRCSCAVSNGPPLQWAGWPHQARAATGGTFREQCLSYWVQTAPETKSLISWFYLFLSHKLCCSFCTDLICALLLDIFISFQPYVCVMMCCCNNNAAQYEKT